MSQGLLTRSETGATARLTLNDPARFNALSDEMLAALSAEIAELSSREDLRVLVLAAAGKAFCAGHDLRQMQAGRADVDGGRQRFAELFARCGAVMQSLSALPQIVIAQVHGVATAGGCQLVASCDLAVASDTAKFGVNGINLGLFCSTPMVPLSRKVPPGVALEMLTTGSFLSAARAREVGLINQVVAPSQLEAKTTALAREVSGKLGLALRMGKAAFWAQQGLSVPAAYGLTTAVMVDNLMAPDTGEGAPDWPSQSE
jgi:enoyl-CoA hydratase/carnithine racemase